MNDENVCIVNMPNSMMKLVESGMAVRMERDATDSLLDAIEVGGVNGGRPLTAQELCQRMSHPKMEHESARDMLNDMTGHACLERFILPTGEATYRYPEAGDEIVIVSDSKQAVVQFVEQIPWPDLDDVSDLGVFRLRQSPADVVVFREMDMDF